MRRRRAAQHRAKGARLAGDRDSADARVGGEVLLSAERPLGKNVRLAFSSAQAPCWWVVRRVAREAAMSQRDAAAALLRKVAAQKKAAAPPALPPPTTSGSPAAKLMLAAGTALMCGAAAYLLYLLLREPSRHSAEPARTPEEALALARKALSDHAALTAAEIAAG